MITFSNLERMGRLGNQLFQIAATVSFALENNQEYCFPKWKYSDFFYLDNCWNNIKCDTLYKEPFFHYEKINVNKYNNLNLSGFFQSSKYFENYDHEIKTLLTPRIGYGINDYTSIHIRRGDYTSLTNEYEQLTLENYYNKAMSLVDNKKFIVFSDDIPWCKEAFKNKNVEFEESNNEIQDFAKMISCKNNIIANSTFSWWAAYLNQHPNKIVVAPNKWFGPKLNHNTKDLIPKKWIKI